MFITIDVGGTNTRVASSRNLKDIENVETFPSQKVLADETKMISDAVAKLSNGDKVEGVAFGVAGIVDAEKCFIEKSPNYNAINSTYIRDLVTGIDKYTPFYCGNDAEIACLGEAVLGAGKDFKNVAYLSLGTGVGGAFIENKKRSLVARLFEPGHQIVDINSQVADGFGVKGSLETLISGESFKRMYKVLPHECKDEKIWFTYGRNVGLGLHNMIALWSPECIVVGGGMSKYFDNFLPGVEDFLKDTTFVSLPKIIKAEFGQGSGLVGGLVMIAQSTGYSL